MDAQQNILKFSHMYTLTNFAPGIKSQTCALKPMNEKVKSETLTGLKMLW